MFKQVLNNRREEKLVSIRRQERHRLRQFKLEPLSQDQEFGNCQDIQISVNSFKSQLIKRLETQADVGSLLRSIKDFASQNETNSLHPLIPQLKVLLRKQDLQIKQKRDLMRICVQLTYHNIGDMIELVQFIDRWVQDSDDQVARLAIISLGNLQQGDPIRVWNRIEGQQRDLAIAAVYFYSNLYSNKVRLIVPQALQKCCNQVLRQHLSFRNEQSLQIFLQDTIKTLRYLYQYHIQVRPTLIEVDSLLRIAEFRGRQELSMINLLNILAIKSKALAHQMINSNLIPLIVTQVSLQKSSLLFTLSKIEQARPIILRHLPYLLYQYNKRQQKVCEDLLDIFLELIEELDNNDLEIIIQGIILRQFQEWRFNCKVGVLVRKAQQRRIEVGVPAWLQSTMDLIQQ